MLKAIKHWLERNASGIAIALTIVVIILSLASFSSMGVKIIKVKNSDKLAHVIAYFILGLSWFHATRNRYNTLNHKILLVVALITFGIIIEALQEGLTTYRKADFNDIVANSIGIFLAAISFNQFRTLLNSMLK